MLCEGYDGFKTEAECLAAFEWFRWADAPDHPVASARARAGEDAPKLRRCAYRCSRCNSRDYRRCSEEVGTWDYYKRKCLGCGFKTSLTVGTAFESFKLKQEKRMSIIFSAVFARYYMGCNDATALVGYLDTQVSYNTARRLLGILRYVEPARHRSWQWEFYRLASSLAFDTKIGRSKREREIPAAQQRRKLNKLIEGL